MEYLKIWSSFQDIVEPLSEDELGRLFRMMMAYASSGEEPGKIAGNERYLWPVAKQQIDLASAKNENLKQNGSKGGRPKTNDNQEEKIETKENQTEKIETKENQEKPNEEIENQTKAIKDKDNVKDKEKDNVKTRKEKELKEKDARFDQFWTAYPRHDSKENARKAFDKLNPDDSLMDTILRAIARQKESPQWQENNGQFIPYPASWLNGKRWQDEVKPAQQTLGKAVAMQQYEQRDYVGSQDDARRRLLAMMDGEIVV